MLESSSPLGGRRMRPREIFIAFLLIGPAAARAAFEETPPTARAAALAGAMTALGDDAVSVIYNPAGLRASPRWEIVAAHTELFSIPGLATQNLLIRWPTKSAGAWGLAYGQRGPDFYRERHIDVAQGIA